MMARRKSIVFFIWLAARIFELAGVAAGDLGELKNANCGNTDWLKVLD
jgi:hypothetical protein